MKKKFLTDRYGEDGGNLFKYEHTEAWDFTSKGNEVVEYVPVPFQAETNETHLDGTGLVTFVKAINELPDEVFSRDIAGYIDPFVQAEWPLFLRLDTNLLTRRLTADPAMRQAYVDAMKRAAGFVGTPYLGPKLEAAYGRIREAALTDTSKPFTNEEFELAVAGLRGILAGRPQDILAQAAGP